MFTQLAKQTSRNAVIGAGIVRAVIAGAVGTGTGITVVAGEAIATTADTAGAEARLGLEGVVKG